MMKIDSLIIYRDRQLIALNKPSTIPVQSRDQPDLTTAVSDLTGSTARPLYRIDQPASGLVLYALDQSTAAALTSQQQQRTLAKVYYAVVSTLPSPPEGSLIHFMRRHRHINKMEVRDSPEQGYKKAELRYVHVACSDRYHLLKIELITGRQHQIRAQLSAIGAPVKGDDKYGFKRRNKNNSIHLHCYSVSFYHPQQKEKKIIHTKFPQDPLWDFFQRQI